MMTSLALEIETSFRITRQYMSRGREFVVRFALRTLLCACLLGISLAIPYFGDVLSLVGAFSTTVIFAIIPITCYIKLKGWRTIRWYTWVMSVGSIFVGLIGCILGSVSSIQALVRDINNDHRRHQHSN
ncbi:hypothetical protein EV182_001200 [Spiromyces aspiralis]|uniref:Uncharacterized protein n=1 Tax=Spiromyces aspiralis TaxID=68401 RepID=A0ACC1HI89_9FUNG|nr:hypothetical protein EV182_001200 [Spiromyces aspiralis]